MDLYFDSCQRQLQSTGNFLIRQFMLNTHQKRGAVHFWQGLDRTHGKSKLQFGFDLLFRCRFRIGVMRGQVGLPFITAESLEIQITSNGKEISFDCLGTNLIPTNPGARKGFRCDVIGIIGRARKPEGIPVHILRVPLVNLVKSNHVSLSYNIHSCRKSYNGRYNSAHSHMNRRTFFITLILFAFACSLPSADQPTPAPTVQHTQQVHALSTQTPTPIAEVPDIPDHVTYILDTVIDYDLHRVNVSETIQYPNHTGQVLPSLTLAIAANLWADCFHLYEVKVDDTPVTDIGLELHRLDLPLPTPLEPDSVVTVTLRYSLSLPFMDQLHSQRARIFGYSEVQMNLVNWYPFIVPFKDGEWLIREPWSHGEYLVYPLADYEVNLEFADQANLPIVAASGFAESNGTSTRYTLTNGRAFALSASREFQVSSMQTGDVTVLSYYLPIYKNAGEAAMQASTQALQVFSEQFGPYPHKTLSVVIADFKDSMEFSGLYFHSRSFYDLYDGSVQNYLTFIAVHETAHQWWFEQVANDQALEPWLDESLTTYSEALYFESLHPELVAWWWSYRVDFFEPHGKIDIPVYEGQDADTYKYIVYLNGAHFLQDLRTRIGDEAFFFFLKDYYTQQRGGIATREDFFRILDVHTDVEYSDIVQTYFK